MSTDRGAMCDQPATVGELKRFLDLVPDSTPLAARNSPRPCFIFRYQNGFPRVEVEIADLPVLFSLHTAMEVLAALMDHETPADTGVTLIREQAPWARGMIEELLDVFRRAHDAAADLPKK